MEMELEKKEMYESKYSKYLIQNTNRFATKEEVIEFCEPNNKNSIKKFSGVPIFYENETLFVDNSDAHYMISGGTGSKKTRTSVINTTLSVIESEENAVITDPKGELFRRTAGTAMRKNYNIKVLNLRNPKRSDGWNPMTLPYRLDVSGKKEEAEELLCDIINSITEPIKLVTKDVYWADRTNSKLVAEAKLQMDSVPEKFFNISTLMQIAKKKNKYLLEELIKECDDKQPFFESIESFMNMSAEKTQDCLYDTVQQAFGPYSQRSALLNILCDNDIDFTDLVSEKKKTIIYIIYPDEKMSMAFLVNLFLTQCYYYLKMYVEENNLPRLKIRVNFICEEFGNLPKVENFANRISMARGFNIRYFLYIQAYSQLVNIYKDDAETIKGNCDWIIYPSKERSFLKEVSDFAGEIRDYQNAVKPLLSVDRIQHLKKYQDGAEAVVIKSGQYPFIVKIPDYEYIEIYNIEKEEKLSEKKRNFYDHTLTMNEWLKGINEEVFNFPFPKTKRTIDRRITQSNISKEAKQSKKTKKQKKNDDVISDEVMKELEAKFDELFGAVDDEE